MTPSLLTNQEKHGGSSLPTSINNVNLEPDYLIVQTMATFHTFEFSDMKVICKLSVHSIQK